VFFTGHTTVNYLCNTAVIDQVVCWMQWIWYRCIHQTSPFYLLCK